MYRKRPQGWLKHIDFIIIDLVCIELALILAYTVRHGSIASMFRIQQYINLMVTLPMFDLVIMVMMRTLHDVIRRGYFREFVAVLQQDVLVFAAAAVYLFTVKEGGVISRITLWVAFVFQIVISYAARICWKQRLVLQGKKVTSNRSVLLVADAYEVREVLQRFRDSITDAINVTGIVVADGSTAEPAIEGIPVVCSLQEAPGYICREWIDEVYICTERPPLELLERCEEMGVTTHRELQGAGGDRQFVEKIAGAHVLTNTLATATTRQLFLKRVMDIAGGLVGSFIALIIILFVGPQIKKASPGPILFKQERIGQNGKHFTMYKIRSMHTNAELRKAELMKDNRVSDGRMFKLDFDPRIIGNEILPDGTRVTGIGEFIRKTSLDEFPQFFNVLMGQMSLVGTRPPTLDEWEKYQYHHRARLAIKPGVTGMWQTSGRSAITDFEDVVKLDTEYIYNWSLGLDMHLLLKTVVSVMHREGAM